MNKYRKFQEFQENYDAAVQSIRCFLSDDTQDPPMNGLVKWMLETDANPYSYLPRQWAGALSSAQGFQSLLGHIYHALYDDGEITFVKVNGEPRIVFAWRHEEGFRERCLSDVEKEMETRHGSISTVEILDIDPNEFGDIYDEWNKGWIKQCFLGDAHAHGLEFAIEHYKKYQQFDPKWIEELAE